MTEIEQLRADFEQLRQELEEVKVKRQHIIDALRELEELEAEIRSRANAIRRLLKKAI